MEADYIEMLLDGAYRAAINDTNFSTYAPNALVVVRRKRDLLKFKRDLLHIKRDLLTNSGQMQKFSIEWLYLRFKRDLLYIKRDLLTQKSSIEWLYLVNTLGH